MLCAFSVLSLVACKADDEEEKASVPSIDYESHNDYSVMVKNNTSYNLVAFKGSPRKSNLIGGIPADATNHKLNKTDGLFTTSQDFMLFIVKEDDYKKNYDNLSALDSSPFANIYAYYNANSDNAMVYEISSKLGGNGTITVYNTSGFNVELRLNGINGETLGYIGDGMAVTTFNAGWGNYYIYPVFRKYNSARNEIMTVYPKYGSNMAEAAGQAVCESFPLADSQKYRTHELRTTDWLGNAELTSGYAYLLVKNNNKQGIKFYDGSEPQITSIGIDMIAYNDSVTFQIPMPEAPNSEVGNRVYLSQDSFAGLSVGTNAKLVSIPEQVFKSDYLYSVTATGDTIYTLSLSDVTVIGKYDFANNKFIETNTDSE